MMTFAGFPRGTHYTPVPDPLFGPLLEAIDDLTELKCTLRAIWLIHHKKGYPRFLTHSQLLSDSVLISGLAGMDIQPGDAISAALNRAVQRGTLLSTVLGLPGQEEPVYLMNTETNRGVLPKLAGLVGEAYDDRLPRRGDSLPLSQRPNIFQLYEDNIHIITPLIADKLKEAEKSYPASWIEEAFRLAVEHEHRSWRYIERILERWATEGKDDGEPRRHSQTDDRQRHLKDYLRRGRSLPRS